MSTENISRLLDADLESGGVDAILAALAADTTAREAVSVYQMVGDALRGRAVEDDGYSRRILEAIDRSQAQSK